MDDDFLARFRERSAYEASARGSAGRLPQAAGPAPRPLHRPAFQELEHEHLFKRVWLYAGHDSELPTPGSYKLCDIVGAPILLARDDDGRGRAFFNACRLRRTHVRGECGQARARLPVPRGATTCAATWCGSRTSGTSSASRKRRRPCRPCAASDGAAGGS